MISTDEQLQQTKVALERVENAVRALRARIMPKNPQLFEALVEDYRTNIQTLRSEIDRYLGLETLGDSAAPLWMVLEGDTISRRDISSRLLSEWLDRFRKSLYGMTAYLETGLTRTGGRPDATLLSLTDPYVVALTPGSIRLGLRLPEIPTQPDLFDHEAESLQAAPYRALRQLLSVASWAATSSSRPPEVATDEQDALSVAARFASKLAPTQRGAVHSVSFSGILTARETPLRLTAETRTRLEGLVKVLSHSTEETITGQIREIDLDQRRIILRERGPGMPDVKCLLPAHLVRRAEDLLDKQVRVRGIVSSATPDTMSVQAIDEASAV